MPVADVDDRPASLLGERGASGIVKIWKAVEELDSSTLPFQSKDRLLKGIRDDAVGIHLNLLHICLIGGEDR